MIEPSFACLDWQDRIRRGGSLMPEGVSWLGDKRATQAAGVFDSLQIPDIPGTPSFKTAGGDWFRDIVRAELGGLDEVTRQRYIRELFLLVPKKNSKTTNGAGLMLTALIVNDRPRAEFLLVAPTQSIAILALSQTLGMIDLRPAKFRERFHVQDHLKKITYLPTGAALQIKSFDTRVMTGVKPAGVLVDELHVIAQSSDADRVIGQIRGGIVSQPEAFFAFITTQSERPPAGVFKAELEKARAIRDGRATGKMLPIIYEFPDDIARAKKDPDKPHAWENPAFWHMVTPNNGKSINVQRLVEDYDTAKLAGEEELRRWASQHLNVEIGLALRSDRWAGADYWERQADETLTLDEIIDQSDVITVGIDGGGLDDLLGFAAIGRHKDTRQWLLYARAWAHAGALERRKSEAPKMRDFERDGDLVIVDEMAKANVEVADIIERIHGAGLLAGVGVDPVGVGLIIDELAQRGITDEDGGVQGVSQGYKLTGTIKTAEVQLADANMVHAGQPLMAWCVGNARVEPKGNAVVITKQASGTGKIDPVMAMFNAVALMALNPDAKSSVYTGDRGLLVFG